ncbi:aminotransferase class IV [Arhodomonas sp. AD133]|uniref:aminotransferase class IV n=1 Tax=Arhodomonas sp. AD133 TaxID=3415009 RepID=UPI003EC08F91
MTQPVCYLDGEWLPLDAARISPLDRGFLFGDGVYEVIPAYGGRAFLLERHLLRLEKGLAAIGLEAAAREDFRGIVHGLLHGAYHDCMVYLQVTRGVAARRDHRFPDGVAPTVFAYATDLPGPPTKANSGVEAVTRDDIRWARCDVKSISLLGHVLLRQAGEDAGAQETVLVRDGEVTEASASNVFAVIDDTVVTPPPGPALLSGITRGLVLELAREAGLPVAERRVAAEELAHVQELWLTSATREILPVIRLDGRAVGDGCPGPVWQCVREAFDRRKRAFDVGARAEETVP